MRERPVMVGLLQTLRSLMMLGLTEPMRDRFLSGSCHILARVDGVRASWIGVQGKDAESVIAFHAGPGVGTSQGVRLPRAELPSCVKEVLDGDGVRVWRPSEEACRDCPGLPRCGGGVVMLTGLGRDKGPRGWLSLSVAQEGKEEAEVFQEFLLAVGEVLDRRIRGPSRVGEALLQSEAEHRAIFENAATPTAILEADMTISRLNREAEILIDLSRHEVQGVRPWTDFVASEDMDRMAELHRRRREDPEGTPDRYRFTLVDARGRRKRIAATIDMIPGTGKSIASLLDVTEQEQTRRELERALEWQEAMTEGSVDAIFVSDETATFVLVNAAAEELTGYPRQQLLEMKIPDLHEELDREAYQRYHRRILSGKTALTEAWVLRADGTKVAVEFNNRRIEVGGQAYMHTVARDVSDRKALEQEVAVKEERYRALFASIRDAILVVGTDRRILDCNPAFTELFGYSLEELRERETRFLYHNPADHERMGRELSEGRDLSGALFSFVYRKKSGETFPGESTVFPLRGSRGDIMGFISIVRDLTVQQEMEAQLRQAQKMEAVGQLTGGIAHDFNNELSVIQLNAELLEEVLKDADPQAREDLHSIRNAARRAARTTAQLLSFSRQAPLEIRDTDLGRLVREMERLVRRAVTERVRVEVACPEDLPLVRVDPRAIEQTLLNLVTNARDAMEEGGTLRIRVQEVLLDAAYARKHPYVAPGPYVRITVEDTGGGIPPEIRDKVFEPFFTTKPVGSGTGLGLSMVYGLVKQQGGHIHLFSEVPTGTTVHLNFPACEGGLEGMEIPESDQAALAIGGSETILLVEDEEPVRRAARRVLEGAGYRVLTAAHGKEGLKVFREHADEVTLVFTDLVMPEMGGAELLRNLRADRPDLKYLMASGYSHEEVEREGILRSFPGAQLIQKPWTMDEVLGAVQKVLGR